MASASDQRSTATFKSRVSEFWRWYPQVAEKFFQAIENGDCRELAPEVGRFMETTLPTLSWVFGPGENGGHSFTLSGEGEVPKQLLAEYWHHCAPEIPKWTFHASRQPTPPERLKDFSISVGDREEVDLATFMVSTLVDEEEEKIDIVAWHPALDQLDEEHHYQLLFLLLDEALGEFGTQTWIGEIKIQPLADDSHQIPLTALPGFIEQAHRYHQWEKLPPLKAYSLYELRQQTDAPRGDTIVGSTIIPNEVFSLIENEGKLAEDPFEGSGAQFAYIAIDSDVFPEGQQSDVRGNMEDALDDALQQQWSGRTLGGAFGIHETYIDLLLLDGEQSLQIVRETLDQLQLQNRYRIEPFL